MKDKTRFVLNKMGYVFKDGSATKKGYGEYINRLIQEDFNKNFNSDSNPEVTKLKNKLFDLQNKRNVMNDEIDNLVDELRRFKNEGRN